MERGTRGCRVEGEGCLSLPGTATNGGGLRGAVVDGYVESGHLRSQNNVREVRGRSELSGEALEARGRTMLTGVSGGRRRTWGSPAVKFGGLAAGWWACVGGK